MKVSLAAQAMSHTVAAQIYSLSTNGKELCLQSLETKLTYYNVIDSLWESFVSIWLTVKMKQVWNCSCNFVFLEGC
jgi:hypothetical protein